MTQNGKLTCPPQSPFSLSLLQSLKKWPPAGSQNIFAPMKEEINWSIPRPLVFGWFPPIVPTASAALHFQPNPIRNIIEKHKKSKPQEAHLFVSFLILQFF